jgi:hypothetical protein
LGKEESMSASRITRREAVRRGSLLALPALLPGRAAAEALVAAAAPPPASAAPPRVEEKAKAAPAADLSGSWDVRIQYAASVSAHRLHLRQRGNDLEGVHQGDFESRDLRGTIDGDAVRVRSSWEHGDSLNYTFAGTLKGDEIAGEVNLGEYLDARFSAKRHAAGRA